MKLEKTADKKTESVVLSGDLSISRAAQLHALLKDRLLASDDVLISFEDVTGADLSCLQLLCSTHRTAAATGKRVLLEQPMPDLIRNLIHQAGFKRRNGCSFSPDTTCLCWEGGN